MKRLGYFEKLSLAARWFLPGQEAGEVIEDYRDIIYEMGGAGEAKIRLGSPVKAVLAMAAPGKVRFWHFIFLVILFCALFPSVSYVCGKYFTSEMAFNVLITGVVLYVGWELLLAGKYPKLLMAAVGLFVSFVLMIIFLVAPSHLYSIYTHSIIGLDFERSFALAAVIALVFFGFRRPSGKLPKLFFAALLLSFLGVAVIIGFMYYSLYVNIDKLGCHAGLAHTLCIIAFIVYLLAAIASLVLARMYDRRWRVVFIMCLAGACLCTELSFLIQGLAQGQYLYNSFFSRGDTEIHVLDEIFLVLSREAAAGTVLAAIGFI